MSDGHPNDYKQVSGPDGKIYTSEAEVHEARYGYKGGGGDGSSGGGGGAILGIILILPIIFAKIVGTIFAVLSKLWIPGKIIQSVIVGWACAQIIIPFFGTALYVIPFDTIILIAVTIFAASATWYWFFHYDVVKKLSISEFADVFKVSFAILFYGIIFVMLFSSLLANLFNDVVGNIVFYILAIVLFVMAISLYLGKTEEYREEAAKVRKFAAFKKFITLAVTIGFCVLTAASFVGSLLGMESIGTMLIKNYAENNTTVSDSSKNEVVVKVKMLEKANLLEKPSEDAKVIRTINKGQKVIIIFDMFLDPIYTESNQKYVPSKYKNDIGWVHVDLFDWEK